MQVLWEADARTESEVQEIWVRGHVGKMKGKGAGVGMGEFQTTKRSDPKDKREGRKEGWIGRGSDCRAALRGSQPGAGESQNKD